MLIVYIFCKKINVIVCEILFSLENDPLQQPTDIVLFPPDDLGNMSNEDNANEDDAMKTVNQLGKGLLSQKGELVLHYNEDKLDENDIYGDQEIHGVIGAAADPQPEPSSANPLRSKHTQKKRDAQDKNVKLGLIWGDHIPLTKMLCKTSLLNKNLRSPLL